MVSRENQFQQLRNPTLDTNNIPCVNTNIAVVLGNNLNKWAKVSNYTAYNVNFMTTRTFHILLASLSGRIDGKL